MLVASYYYTIEYSILGGFPTFSKIQIRFIILELVI